MNEYSAHFGIPMNTFSTFLKPYIWSVVSNIFICPFHIWDVILPIDFHIFQDGKNHQPDILSIPFHSFVPASTITTAMNQWLPPRKNQATSAGGDYSTP
jgi:hypothetical protein